MIATIRLVSRNISFMVVGALLINISAPMYSQALLEKAKSGISAVGKQLQSIDFTKGFQLAGQAMKELDIPGRLQEVARSVSSRIKNSLSEKLDQLKDVAPKVIIPKLLENVDKFGQQIGYVANCMLKGSCSEQERAAFIAISITILALTIALVGFSITVAATSKEIDTQTIVISEQVKGWSPQAIITRLKNTAAEFKQSLLGLQTCLLKRQCTANQKKGLYGFAITLVVLATIIVGIGIGAYIYSQHKEKERAEAAAREAAQRGQPTKPQEKPVTGPLFPEKQPEVQKPSVMATLQDQAKSAIASVRDQAKTQIANLQELAKDWKSQIKDKVTPMQQYFQKQVIEKGTHKFQETATKIQELLTEQAQAAQQALQATAANVQATLIEKAQAANAKIKELSQKFFTELKEAGRSFLDIALDKVLNVKINVLEPAINKIQEYTTRMFRAIKPLETVRLNTQLMNITNDLNTLLEKSTQLQNQWTEAVSQLAQRTPWIKSHVRPVALGGKTNEQIEAEAKTMFPLAYVADDIWNFYPQLVAKINDLKLGGPALIFESFVKRSADLLDAINEVTTSMGKVGAVIVSKELSDALRDLRNQILRLASDIRTTANVKPILSKPPQTTSAALMEAFKGFVWRVGFGLPNKINGYLNSMLQKYETTVPLLDAIMEQNAVLLSITQNISTLIKADVAIRIEEQPIVNSARLPIILAQSLGLVVSQIKAIINDILIKTDTVIESVSSVLEEAKPAAEMVNTAFGGDFINPGIIQGLSTIKSDIDVLRTTVQKVRSGITDAVQIPFGV